MVTQAIEEVKGKIEAVLFAAGRAVPLGECEMLAQVRTPGLVKEAIKELKQEYDGRNSPLLIVEEADGWKLTVREKYLPVVQHINPETELSKATMETLAIIAWRSPVLQSEVIHIRTNKAYDHITELEEAAFISKERHGRTYLIKTTKKFYDYFDLPNQQAVKELFKEFKDLEPQKKMEEFGSEQPEAHRVKLEVYDASASLASLAAPQEKLATENQGLGGLEVFEVSEQETTQEESEVVSLTPVKLPAEEDQTKAEGSVLMPQESEAQKARRLAQELLEERHEIFEKLPKKQQSQDKKTNMTFQEERLEDVETTAEEFEEYPGEKETSSPDQEDEDA